MGGERRGDLVADDLRGFRAIVAGHRRGAAGERGDGHPLVDRLALDRRHLAQCLVEQEGGRGDADARIVAQPLRFALKIGGIGGQPGEIGVGVGGGFDAVIGVEKVGRFDEAAGVLRHGIGRVAVGPVAVHHRHVAEREGEAFGGEFVRGAGYLDIGAGGGGERGQVHGAQSGEAVGDMGGDLRLARRAFVAEAAFERGAGAGVEAKAGRAFRRVGEHRFGHGGQRGLRAGVGRVGRGAGGERRQSEDGGTGDKEIAARGGHVAWLRQGGGQRLTSHISRRFRHFISSACSIVTRGGSGGGLRLRSRAGGDAGIMRHRGAAAIGAGGQGAQRGEHDPAVGLAIMADDAATAHQRLPPVAPDQRHGAPHLVVQPHLDRPVPGGGETFRPRPRPQQIGRARRTANAARRLRNDAASGQGIDEGMLRVGRPAARAALQLDGGEVEQVRRVWHDGEHGMGWGM